MSKIKQLPVDMNTWKLLNYDRNYFVPVAESAIKFYENQLRQLKLTGENREIYIKSIDRIRELVNYKI